jgi:hypothetical protein
LVAGGAAWRLHVGTLPPPKLADRSSAPLPLPDDGAGATARLVPPGDHAASDATSSAAKSPSDPAKAGPDAARSASGAAKSPPGGAHSSNAAAPSDRATSGAADAKSAAAGAKLASDGARSAPDRARSATDAAKTNGKSSKRAVALVAALPASFSSTAATNEAAEPTPVQPLLPAGDASASLTVATSPWCDLRIDGTAHGRTPQTVALPAGHHRVECTNPAAGRSLVRDLDLRPGDHTTVHEKLYPSVRVVPALSHADAFAVDDGAPTAGAREVEPGRRRITFYAAGHAVATRYVDVPPEGCRLVDAPAAACAKP